MLTNIKGTWQAIFVFGGSLGYALGEAHGAAIGLAIVGGLGAVFSIFFD